MNFIEDIKHYLRETLRGFLFPAESASSVFNTEIAVSKEMEESMEMWYALYINKPPWADRRVKTIGLPAAICRELARPTLSEFVAVITGDGGRADYLSSVFTRAQEHFTRDLELGLALGGVALKPYLANGSIYVDAIGFSGFQPTKFAENGECIGGVFRDKAIGKYIRLEYHELEGTTYTVKNKAFLTDNNGGSIGNEVSLKTVPEWANIEPLVQIEGVQHPLFSYFKAPFSNNIDVNSPLGVSVYSGATIGLLQQADEHWERMEWEYRSGSRKIYMEGEVDSPNDFDADLFKRGIFSADGDLFETFNPDFRDEALYRGFQNILKMIEFNVGLSYGTLSDPQTIALTATQIKNSKQRMYITICDIQKELRHTFDTLIAGIDTYATLYGLAPEGTYSVSYEFDDGVLDDEDTVRLNNQDMRNDVLSGYIRPEIYLSRKYGVTEEEAKTMMPDMETMLAEEKAGENEEG